MMEPSNSVHLIRVYNDTIYSLPIWVDRLTLRIDSSPTTGYAAGDAKAQPLISYDLGSFRRREAFIAYKGIF
jgi:hypothetical protein